MEKKTVCGYCGTIYDEEKGKCPLCGSEVREQEEEKPYQRRHLTKKERRAHRQAATKKSGKQESKEIPKKLLVASVVFLSLAVLVVLFFIGDMLDWWPGLENVLNRDQRLSESVYTDDDPTCTFLNITPEEIIFTQPGQTRKLYVAVNSSCEEPVHFSASDASIASVSEESTVSETEYDQLSITVEITAVSAGQTFITVDCGEKSMTCTVTCDFENESADPELNLDDVTLTLPDETVSLRVTNLSDGQTVTWSSSDESVAAVDDDGTVTAVSSGTATITAEVDGNKTTARIQCDFSAIAENDYHLSHTDVTIAVGESFTLILLDASGNRISNVTYSIGNAGVCSVTGSSVTGVSSGITQVTVSYAGKSYVCVVRVS